MSPSPRSMLAVCAHDTEFSMQGCVTCTRRMPKKACVDTVSSISTRARMHPDLQPACMQANVHRMSSKGMLLQRGTHLSQKIDRTPLNAAQDSAPASATPSPHRIGKTIAGGCQPHVFALQTFSRQQQHMYTHCPERPVPTSSPSLLPPSSCCSADCVSVIHHSLDRAKGRTSIQNPR